MIADDGIAAKAAGLLADASFRLRESLDLVEKTCPAEEIAGYRPHIENALARITSILESIRAAHPSMPLSLPGGGVVPDRQLRDLKPSLIRSPGIATDVSRIEREAWQLVYESAGFVKSSGGETSVYERAASHVLVDLMPYLVALFKEHPSLKPPDW